MARAATRSRAKKTTATQTQKTKSGESASDASRAAEGVSEPTDQPESQPNRQPEADTVLGQIATLLIHSPAHKFVFMSDWEWLILPAVMNRQFRIFRRDGRPFAYVSWASVDDNVSKRIAGGEIKLQPTEWTSGDNIWLIDLIAPFGGQDATLTELRENVLDGKRVRFLQPAPDGKGLAVTEW